MCTPVIYRNALIKLISVSDAISGLLSGDKWRNNDISSGSQDQRYDGSNTAHDNTVDSALLWNPFSVVYIIVQRQLAIYTWLAATAETVFDIITRLLHSGMTRIHLPPISRNKYIAGSGLLGYLSTEI